jgi:hypothetical protein
LDEVPLPRRIRSHESLRLRQGVSGINHVEEAATEGEAGGRRRRARIMAGVHQVGAKAAAM